MIAEAMKNNMRYVFGFNGKEKDNEIKGEGNSYDFGARIYDPRIGQWLSPDPLQKNMVGLSPFSAFADNCILLVDPDGKVITGYNELKNTNGITRFAFNLLERSKTWQNIINRFVDIHNGENPFNASQNGIYSNVKLNFEADNNLPDDVYGRTHAYSDKTDLVDLSEQQINSTDNLASKLNINIKIKTNNTWSGIIIALVHETTLHGLRLTKMISNFLNGTSSQSQFSSKYKTWEQDEIQNQNNSADHKLGATEISNPAKETDFSPGNENYKNALDEVQNYLDNSDQKSVKEKDSGGKLYSRGELFSIDRNYSRPKSYKIEQKK